MKLHTMLAVTAIVAVPAGPLWAAEKPLTPSPEEYGRLCRQFSAVTGYSVGQIRSNLPSLAGRHVEIRGKVLGRAHGDLTQAGLVDMYLKCGEESCFVACPPDVSELQPGRCVRVLVRVPEEASDIEDCQVKAVTEDPLGYEREEAKASDNGGQRLEIGEAAYGVRDQAPNFGRATPPPAVVPPGVTQPVPPVGTGQAQSGTALPPEMRGLTSLSGRPGVQPAVSTGNVPRVRLVGDSGQWYDKAVKTYTDWVRNCNPSLTVQQADLIVRWTLYYSVANKVDHRLVLAVMKYESDFDPRCVSHAGAMGLMQLMPCNVEDFKVKDPYDIAENIRGGIEHLAEFLRAYQGRSYFEQTVLALACYNAGPGAVAKYGGVPPYAETQSYVRKVPALFAQLVKDGYP